jgi:hypothetical protein
VARRSRFLPMLSAVGVFALAQPSVTRAQTVDLSRLDDVGGFPNSPSEAPIRSPEDDSPPTSLSPASNAPPAGSQPADQPDEGPNYGRFREHRSKLYTPNTKSSPPLSPVKQVVGPNQRRRRTDQLPARPLDRTFLSPPAVTLPPSTALRAVPLRARRAQEEADAFAPTGVRAGQLILKPFVETSVGHETNPNQVATGAKASAAIRTNGGLNVVSDFSSSSLTADIHGGYSEFPSNSNADRPDASATVDGRVDLTRTDTLDTEARFTLATQTPGSPLLAVPNSVFITNRPTITSEGATLGETHQFGPLALGLKGTFDRTQYGDATQSDGSIFRYSQDNYNDYGVVARATYEPTPAIVPFAEAGFDSRVRDNAIDQAGYARDSIGGTARVGATMDVLGYVTGTISGGYLDRHYNDPRLPNLRGPTLDGQLVYAATPLTTLTFRASTTASETTLAGASGAISRSFGVELAHTFFRAFTLSGIATVNPNDYQGVRGNETYTTYTLKGAYSVTRDVQLIASASRQSLSSTFASEAFRDTIFLAGVRLQR